MKKPNPMNNKEITGRELLNCIRPFWCVNRKERCIFNWIKNDLINLESYARQLTDIQFNVFGYVKKTDEGLQLVIQMDDNLIYDNTTATMKESIYNFYNHWDDILNMIEYYAKQYNKNVNNNINKLIKRIKALDIFPNKTGVTVYKEIRVTSKYDITIYYLHTKICKLSAERYKENNIEKIINENINEIKDGISRAIINCYLYYDSLLIEDKDNDLLVETLEKTRDLYSMEIIINCLKVPYEVKDRLRKWKAEHPLFVEQNSKLLKLARNSPDLNLSI